MMCTTGRLEGSGRASRRSFATRFFGFWRYVKGLKRYEKFVELVLAVLSIAVNTAMCEQLFSELVLIHTRTRNRVKATKARNIHVVRKWVRWNGGYDNGVSNAGHLHRIVDPQERSIFLNPQKNVSTRVPGAGGSDRQQSSVQALTFDYSKTGQEDADLLSSPIETFLFWEELLEEI
ncbi:hypothetical protein PybrP1_010997 [[Pythium] brassicae (nom. inval.)]|nr:hypothetical protein PybrP1_010997 [[Pythium] brassicae (nom. inval.)]